MSAFDDGDKRTREHLAKQYKNSAPGSLEYWIYLAACNIICHQGQEIEHEQRCRDVGAYAKENGCSIWHACWATGDRSQKCYCVPCVVARGEKVTTF